MDSTTQRPMSDRHHEPPDAEHRFEVRIAESGPDEEAPWRSVAFAVGYEDAARVAAALVSAAGGDRVFTEVWGPGDGRSDHRVLARFPLPSREEQQAMWLEAADKHFAEGYSDLRH